MPKINYLRNGLNFTGVRSRQDQHTKIRAAKAAIMEIHCLKLGNFFIKPGALTLFLFFLSHHFTKLAMISLSPYTFTFFSASLSESQSGSCLGNNSSKTLPNEKLVFACKQRLRCTLIK